jgi:dihydrofolate reductase
MRKVTFGGANSLDNFIARKNDAVDWLMWNDEVTEIMKDYWATIDTVVMGRRTYEVAMATAPDMVENPYPNVKTYVFSRTLKPGEVKGVEIISEDGRSSCGSLKTKRARISSSWVAASLPGRSSKLI